MSSWTKKVYYMKCDTCGVVNNYEDLSKLFKQWNNYEVNGRTLDVCLQCYNKIKWPERSCNHKERIYHNYIEGKKVKLCKDCFKDIKGEQ